MGTQTMAALSHGRVCFQVCSALLLAHGLLGDHHTEEQMGFARPPPPRPPPERPPVTRPPQPVQTQPPRREPERREPERREPERRESSSSFSARGSGSFSGSSSNGGL